MTFGILRLNALPEKILLSKDFMDKYNFDGFYLDHNNRTEGFVFREDELEAFVEEHKKDPVEVVGSGLENLSNSFVDDIKTLDILVFKAAHKHYPKHVIPQNYDRFMLYKKK